MKLKYLLLLYFLPFLSYPQNTSQDMTKPAKNYVFGQIFAGFRYGFNPDFKPQAAFEFNQGIIGYYHQLSDNLSGKIMFDVTRTTHIYEITDSAGNQLNYSYFEGSKYTAYLKMAEIKWDISKNFIFRVGQLLTTQYLTFIDPFWGFRYVDVTFQEKFRLGMPADFGIQLDYKIGDKFINQFSVVNGEGPFKYQDINGKFIYSNNIQFYPTDKMTVKLYADFGPATDTTADTAPKSTVSGFAGMKSNRYRIAVEYVYVFNYGFSKDTDYYGFSVFGSFVINDKFQVLARYDHLSLETAQYMENTDYIIAGLQYEPVHKFTTSANFRYYSNGDLPFIYANFGLKF